MRQVLVRLATVFHILLTLGLFAGCGEQSTTAENETPQIEPNRVQGQQVIKEGVTSTADKEVRGLRHSTNDTELAATGPKQEAGPQRAALTSEEQLAACEDYDYLSLEEQAELESVCFTQR